MAAVKRGKINHECLNDLNFKYDERKAMVQTTGKRRVKAHLGTRDILRKENRL